MLFFNKSKGTHDSTGGFTMSRKCDHDWFDYYMMYSAMSSNDSGGGDWGCLLLLIEAAGGTILMGAILYFILSIFGAV